MTTKDLTPQKCIELLSPELKSYLYDIHQKTVEQTVRDGKLDPSSKGYLPPDVLSLKKHRYKLLLENGTSMFQGKDAEILECYISSFPKSIKHRELTKTMTDVVDSLTNLLMHIGIWITHEYRPEYHITVCVLSRRKDWEGEETKALIKSVSTVYNNNENSISIQPPEIRDLFGIRIILEQTTDTYILLQVMKIVVNILTNPSSTEFNLFYNWLRTTNKFYGGSPIPKERLLPFKKYDFSMSHEKNYITKPKANGYKSWQATFTIGPSSPKACGSMFELQGRTSQMEEILEYGFGTDEQDCLGHDDYKKELYKLKKELFSINDYKGGLLYYNPIIGYDVDGIGKSKQISVRTSSVHLVSETTAHAE